MNEDRIERDTLIEASMDRVWSLVTEPGFWVAGAAGLPGTAAKAGETIVAKDTEDRGYPVRVEKVDPKSYVSYRWASAFPGEDLSDGNSTLVEFTLTPEDGKTRLRVVESGFAALTGSPELRSQAVKDNTGGWQEVFEAFRTRAEKPSG